MQAYVTRRRWAIALVFFMAFAWTSAMFSYALAAEIYYTRCNANLRAEASSDSKSILIIRGGEKVSVSGKSGEWLRVVYGNRKGYIRADLLVQMTRSGYIPLAKGDESPQVKDLQKRLRVLDYLSIGADGEFGETTEQAVYDFQKRNRLDPDGIAGG
ncbi:MAG: peptidoglycan-binding protein, partial [Clostridia bacterium]